VSFGLLTVNDDGVNLIDQDFKSMCVVASGSATTNEAGTPVRKSLSYAGVNPMLAVDSHGVEFGIVEQGCSGGTFYWTVARADGSSTAAPFDYWIFDDVPAITPSGYGMAVWNSAGQLVFDSNHKYLRPGPAPAGGVNAVITCNGAIRVVSIDLGGSWSNDKHLNTFWVDGSGVLHTSHRLYSSGTAGSDVGYVPNTVFMQVDVTNY